MITISFTKPAKIPFDFIYAFSVALIIIVPAVVSDQLTTARESESVSLASLARLAPADTDRIELRVNERPTFWTQHGSELKEPVTHRDKPAFEKSEEFDLKLIAGVRGCGQKVVATKEVTTCLNEDKGTVHIMLN